MVFIYLFIFFTLAVPCVSKGGSWDLQDFLMSVLADFYFYILFFIFLFFYFFIFILFYFILFYFILFYFILFYFILLYFIFAPKEAYPKGWQLHETSVRKKIWRHSSKICKKQKPCRVPWIKGRIRTFQNEGAARGADSIDPTCSKCHFIWGSKRARPLTEEAQAHSPARASPVTYW